MNRTKLLQSITWYFVLSFSYHSSTVIYFSHYNSFYHLHSHIIFFVESFGPWRRISRIHHSRYVFYFSYFSFVCRSYHNLTSLLTVFYISILNTYCVCPRNTSWIINQRYKIKIRVLLLFFFWLHRWLSSLGLHSAEPCQSLPPARAQLSRKLIEVVTRKKRLSNLVIFTSTLSIYLFILQSFHQYQLLNSPTLSLIIIIMSNSTMHYRLETTN